MGNLDQRYTLVSGAEAIDAEAAHAFLTASYWSAGIPLTTVKRAISNSVCVAIRDGSRQVAMARVVTDCATFAYLADVYVLENHRGKGLSAAMLSHLHDHPDLQGLRRWMLMTRDAHGLYERFNWKPLADPILAMELFEPAVYQ
jgi:GNAT superfamily N-acetyltransferase